MRRPGLPMGAASPSLVDVTGAFSGRRIATEAIFGASPRGASTPETHSETGLLGPGRRVDRVRELREACREHLCDQAQWNGASAAHKDQSRRVLTVVAASNANEIDPTHRGFRTCRLADALQLVQLSSERGLSEVREGGAALARLERYLTGRPAEPRQLAVAPRIWQSAEGSFLARPPADRGSRSSSALTLGWWASPARGPIREEHR